MADKISPQQRSYTMSQVRGKGNVSTELRLIGILRAYSLTGWRRNFKLFGKPDFVFPKQRVAVFVDGDFWHGHLTRCRMPTSNVEFWKSKIAANRKRDRLVSPRCVLFNFRTILLVVAWLVCLSAAHAAQTDRLPAELLVRLEDALAERNTDLRSRQNLIAEIDRLLDNSPLDAGGLTEIRLKVRFLEALTNFRLSNWDLCESQIGQLRSAVDPQTYPELSFNCRSLQAAVMLMKGQSEEGQKALEALLATDTSKLPAPMVDRARINHAFALEENGRFDEAVAQYQRIMFKAIEERHDLPAIQAGNNLLSILLDNEDRSAARQVLVELEPITARNPKTVGTLAIKLHRRILQFMDGDLDEALKGLKELIEQRDLPPVLMGRAHNWYATVLEQNGDLDDAIEHTKIAFEILANSPTEKMFCHVLMARLLLRKGDYDGALNQLADEHDGRVSPALKKQIYQLKLESSLRKNGQDKEANWVAVLLKSSEDRENRFLKIIAKDFEQQLALVKKTAADQQRDAVLQAAIQSDRFRQDRVYFFAALMATCGLGACGLAVVHLRRRTERRKFTEQLALNAKLESLVESRTLELKQNLAVQAELSQALERRKRIETVGQLAGNVAHDINNLLQVIANANQTLADAASSEQLRSQAIQISNESLRHGAGIVGQILAYSRRQALLAKSVRVSELLSSSRALFQSAVGETIALHIEDSSQDVHVFVDPSVFTTALLNLLSNAADAMPNGGTVTIRASLTEQMPPLPSSLAKGVYVYLTVKDTGTGFHPEDLARAFEPFFSTKRVGDGTGLGLSSVKDFVNRCGGDIRIESSPGAGACVQIWLPRHQAHDSTHSPPRTSVGFEGKRLLLVEDHPSVAQSIKLLLKQLRLEVVWSASGDEATTLLQQDRRFDVVLSDIRMPGNLDGVQLAKWISSTYPQMPVILMSGYSDVPIDQLTVPFLQKPFKLDELMETLQKLLKTT